MPKKPKDTLDDGEMIDCPYCGHYHPLPEELVNDRLQNFRCDNCNKPLRLTAEINYRCSAR